MGTNCEFYCIVMIFFQAYGERNYHIFYEMLAGLPQEEKDKYSLKKAEDYAYLNQVMVTGVSACAGAWILRQI